MEEDHLRRRLPGSIALDHCPVEIAAVERNVVPGVALAEEEAARP